MGKMFFNILATFAEFEADLIRMRTREGMAIARAKGKLRGNSFNPHRPMKAGALPWLRTTRPRRFFDEGLVAAPAQSYILSTIRVSILTGR